MASRYLITLLAALMAVTMTTASAAYSTCQAGTTVSWTVCRDAYIADKLNGLVVDSRIMQNSYAAFYFWIINDGAVLAFWLILSIILFSNYSTKFDAILQVQADEFKNSQ